MITKTIVPLERLPFTLRSLRLEAGMSQEALGHEVGTNQAGVSNIERHAFVDIKLSTLVRYLEAMGYQAEVHITKM